MEIFDFPIDSDEIEGQTFLINDSDDETFTEVDLFDDEHAYIYDNELCFEKNEDNELQVIWKGTIDDFYSGSETPLPFRMKCEFKPDEIVIDED